MEVCEGSDASRSGDMGFSHTNEIHTMCCAGGNLLTAVERSEHISVGNAKVRASFLLLFAVDNLDRDNLLTASQILLLGPLKASDADDTE